jgi:DNA-directed RNA polymerase specialized sigma24 family protein
MVSMKGRKGPDPEKTMTTTRPTTSRLTSLRGPASIRASMGEDDASTRRRALLEDPKVHAEIRKVARLRGAASDRAEDILQEVLTEALEDDRVPDHDPEEGRLYLCGMARNKTIDSVRADKVRTEYVKEKKADAKAMASGDAEEPHVARNVAEWGHKTFGDKFSWFVRHAVHGETHRAIAESAGVSQDYVRHTVASIRARTTASLVAALAVALLVAFAFYRARPVPGGPAGATPDYANTAHGPGTPAPSVTPPAPSSAIERVFTPAEQGARLRERAKRELGEGNYDECITDTVEAQRIDPAGHTPAIEKLRKTCVKKSDELNSKQ